MTKSASFPPFREPRWKKVMNYEKKAKEIPIKDVMLNSDVFSVSRVSGWTQHFIFSILHNDSNLMELAVLFTLLWRIINEVIMISHVCGLLHQVLQIFRSVDIAVCSFGHLGEGHVNFISLVIKFSAFKPTSLHVDKMQ